MAARLLALAVPSLFIHLLMRGSGSVPDPHVLGAPFLTGPTAPALMRKMKEAQGLGEYPAPLLLLLLLLLPFYQPIHFALLPVSSAQPRSHRPSSNKVMLDFLLGWGKFYRNKLGVRLVSFLFLKKKIFRYYSL